MTPEHLLQADSQQCGLCACNGRLWPHCRGPGTEAIEILMELGPLATKPLILVVPTTGEYYPGYQTRVLAGATSPPAAASRQHRLR
jgi:hypothetical protein